MTDLQRVGVKFFFRSGADVPLVDFIPVLHRWIQTSAVDGLLVDVADYSHVPEGPGIVLVAHEGMYSIDEGRGRRGLAYQHRRPQGEVGLDHVLHAAVGAAAKACRLLEEDFEGRIGFEGDELEVFAIDRLLAPNDASTREAFQPHLDALLHHLYPGTTCAVAYEADARERFAASVKCPVTVPFCEIVARALR